MGNISNWLPSWTVTWKYKLAQVILKYVLDIYVVAKCDTSRNKISLYYVIFMFCVLVCYERRPVNSEDTVLLVAAKSTYRRLHYGMFYGFLSYKVTRNIIGSLPHFYELSVSTFSF